MPETYLHIAFFVDFKNIPHRVLGKERWQISPRGPYETSGLEYPSDDRWSPEGQDFKNDEIDVPEAVSTLVWWIIPQGGAHTAVIPNHQLKIKGVSFVQGPGQPALVPQPFALSEGKSSFSATQAAPVYMYSPRLLGASEVYEGKWYRYYSYYCLSLPSHRSEMNLFYDIEFEGSDVGRFTFDPRLRIKPKT